MAVNLRVEAFQPFRLPLFGRAVIETCPRGEVKCTDGSGDCCPLNAQCTVTRGNIPICRVADCSGQVCTGILEGLCCPYGNTCNEAKTRCVSTEFVFGGGKETGAGDVSIQTIKPTPVEAEATTTPNKAITFPEFPTLTAPLMIPPPRIPLPLPPSDIFSFPTRISLGFHVTGTKSEITFSDLSTGDATSTLTTRRGSSMNTRTQTGSPSSMISTAATATTSTASAAPTTTGEGATSASDVAAPSASPTGAGSCVVADLSLILLASSAFLVAIWNI